MRHREPSRPGELTLKQDVVQVIFARGELRRDEIKDLWGLDEETTRACGRSCFSERLLEPLRGTGGFRARIARRPLPPEEPGTLAGLFSTDWETHGAERLAELLSHAELEALLGDLVYTLRRARMKLTGEDRRGTKRELAAALVIAHGVDLFRHRGIRSLVAKRTDVGVPQPLASRQGRSAGVRAGRPLSPRVHRHPRRGHAGRFRVPRGTRRPQAAGSRSSSRSSARWPEC